MVRVMLGLILVGILSGQLIRLPLFGVNVLGLDLAVGLATIAGLVYVWRSGRWRDIARFPVLKIWLLLSGIWLLSLIVGADHLTVSQMAVAGLFLVRSITYGVVAMLLFALAQPAHWLSYQRWLLASFIAVAVVGFGQLGLFPDFELFEYLGWDPHYHRLLSTFLDPNLVGIYLSIGVGLGLLMWLKNPPLTRADRWGLVVSIGLMIAAVLATLSRSGLLALVAGLGVIGWLWRRRFFWIGLAVIGLVVTLSPRLQERLAGVWQLDVTVQHRLVSWEQGWAMVRDNPWLGVGYNAIAERRGDYPTKLDTELVARAASGFDSSLLTIAAAAGGLGLAAFLWLVISVWVVAWRKRDIPGTIFSPLFLVMTTSLFLASWFVNAWLYAPIFLLWFVVMGLSLKEHDE
jgi:O-antigen ligase